MKNNTTKTRYVKPLSVKELETLVFTKHYEKHPAIPESARLKKKFRDDSANSLTKCVVSHLQALGYFATRLDSKGTWRPDIKKFVPSQQRKGLGDVMAIVSGYTLFIEIKIGADRLSKAQTLAMQEVKKAGGFYFVVKSFDHYREQIDKIFSAIDCNYSNLK